ncbi:MAG: chromate efflux transporter [Bdellovibrionia bacterium]
MQIFEVFWTAFKLGLVSFGGPVAHLSYFRQEYVENKKWLSEQNYSDLVALCQFLPGPASSQVGMAIGYQRAGIAGAIFSWLGFTLPSALVLILFALGLSQVDLSSQKIWLHGLKIAAVAIVAHAILSMLRSLCPDYPRKIIAAITVALLIFTGSPSWQFLILTLAGISGVFLFKPAAFTESRSSVLPKIKSWIFFIVLFLALLILPSFVRENSTSFVLNLFDSFYRVGALVFGGGHVVLPLLQNEVVHSGIISKELFLAGYGLANAMPGPLFALSAFIGAASFGPLTGWAGGLFCLIAIFLPSFLLIFGVMPIWGHLKNNTLIRRALMGVNAAVVGLLVAAFWDPVWTSAIFDIRDFVLALLGFLLLERKKMNSWKVVVGITFLHTALGMFN